MRQLFGGQYPDLVMFDLDGTLVDSVPDLACAIDKMLLALGLPEAGVDKVIGWVGKGAAALVRRALLDASHAAMVDESLFEQAYALFLRFYGEATADQSQLYPGALECLEGLVEQDIKLGLVTNKPIDFTHSMLTGFGLERFFSVVLGGDSLAKKKPDPLPLLDAMRRCDVAAENSLMVGDSINDVSAARAAGCPVVCVPYGYNHGEAISLAKPDLIVDRLDLLL
ncbi:phosphoglycolate phosphatase [Neptuniibacter marinus]|uniref:phosphoglycolate phosphatase n=1 Tax=Neptuniibacter marinus TaxID=1806670 RepID=UPI00083765CF|nr:phosphoglycolate phosphatase [Neptuniibacter marinus]